MKKRKNAQNRLFAKYFLYGEHFSMRQ